MTIDRNILTMILTIWNMILIMVVFLINDYDDSADDGPLRLSDFDEPDDYELYHGLHGPDDCGVYCVSWGDVGCHEGNVAEVAPSADLAGNVTIDVTSLADPVSVVTAGVAFRVESEERDVVPSDCVCDYGDCFYDDRPDYFDYDNPYDYDCYLSSHEFDVPDDF